MKPDDLVVCAGCGDEGYLADEVFFYELPVGGAEGEFSLVLLCLDCGPEENREELDTPIH